MQQSKVEWALAKQRKVVRRGGAASGDALLELGALCVELVGGGCHCRFIIPTGSSSDAT